MSLPRCRSDRSTHSWLSALGFVNCTIAFLFPPERNDLSVDDEEGQELPDAEAARAWAQRYALDMTAASVLEQHKINLHHRIQVTNESEQDVLTVRFGDVITVES